MFFLCKKNIFLYKRNIFVVYEEKTLNFYSYKKWMFSFLLVHK